MNLDVEMNKVYKPYYDNLNRYQIFYGGAGSGKSYFQGQKTILRTLTDDSKKTLIVRKVGKTIRHSTFSLLSSIIEKNNLGHLFNIHKSDMSISCVNGNTIISNGLDDVGKLKSITDITDIWIEEAFEISKEDFQQLDLRLRGETDHTKQITLTFNPVSHLSWLNDYFFKNPKNKAEILKTTYKDNKFVDEEYKQVIEDLKHQDPVYYQIYALGNWGVLGNLVYTNYVIEDFPTKPKHFDNIVCGLDFGYNDPSAFVVIGLKDDELYIIDELYQSGLTNTDLIDKLNKEYSQYKGRRVTADSAEPDRIKELKRAGWRVKGAKKGKDSVSHGIDWLRRHKIHIHEDCANTAAEMQQYKYKEDKDGNVLDKPVDFKNHAMDSLRYGVEPWRKEKAIEFLR